MGDAIAYAVLGGVTLPAWLAGAHRLRRHLFDAPRHRRKQSALLSRYAIATPDG